MTRLIVRLSLLFMLAATLLIGISQLIGTTMTSPLVITWGIEQNLIMPASTDMRTGIVFDLELPLFTTGFSSDNCQLATIGSASSSFFILNLANGQHNDYPMPGMTGVQYGPGIIGWSPDNHWLALSYSSNDLHPLVILDMQTGERIMIDEDFRGSWHGWLDANRFYYTPFRSPDFYAVYDMTERAVQPDELFADDARIRWNSVFLHRYGDEPSLYDAATRTTLAVFPAFWEESDSELRSVELSPDRAYLAFTAYNTAQNQQTPYLYHLATKTLTWLNPVYTSYLLSLTWSPDSTRLAYQAVTPELNRRDDVLVIDSASGEVLHRIPTLTVAALTWSPDSRYLVLYGSDLRVLDTYTGQVIPVNMDLSNHSIRILWSPDSTWFGVSRYDRNMNTSEIVIITVDDRQLRPAQVFSGLSSMNNFCFPS